VGEIISGWNVELEKQTARFRGYAKQIADWDKHILAASARQLELNTELKYVQSAQTRAKHELEILEVHQREVHTSLLSMEESVTAMFQQAGSAAGGSARGAAGAGALGGDAQGAAGARDQMYQAAEEISRQLVSMGQQLRDTIETLNDSRAREADPANPVSAAVSILNNQLSSLAWLDKQATAIERKLASVEAAGPDGTGMGAPALPPGGAAGFGSYYGR
jgi:hypothetical protein